MRLERIELDFASATRRASRVGVALVVMGCMALALGGLSLTGAWAAHAESQRAAAAADAPRARAAAPTPAESLLTPAELTLERQIGGIARALQTPWSELLAALEAAASPAVALLTVEPASTQQTVRLSAQARDPQAMLNYLAALQADRRLSQVTLTAHELPGEPAGAPVRFQHQARWGSKP